MVAAVCVSDNNQVSNPNNQDEVLSFLNEKTAPTQRDIKTIAELIDVLSKIINWWDIASVTPKLLVLVESSSIPSGITVSVIKKNPELLKKVRDMLTASSHYGAKLFLYGKGPTEGLLDHLQKRYPENFKTKDAAKIWLYEQWGISKR